MRERLVDEFYRGLRHGELKTFRLAKSKVAKAEPFIWHTVQKHPVGLAGLKDRHSLFVIVKHEYQGRGIGRALVAKVLDIAKKRKLAYVDLSVFKCNQKALNIYKKYGFIIAADTEIDDKDCYYMVLVLNWKGWIVLYQKKMLYLLVNIKKRLAGT